MTIANLNNDLLIWSKIQVYKYTNFYFLFIHTVSIHRIVNKAIIEEEEEEEVNFNYRTFLWIGAAKSDWNWIITTNIKTRSNRDCYSLEINVNSSCKSVESKCRRLSKEASNISLEFLHPSYSATSIPAKFQSDSNGSTIEQCRTRARWNDVTDLKIQSAAPRLLSRKKDTEKSNLPVVIYDNPTASRSPGSNSPGRSNVIPFFFPFFFLSPHRNFFNLSAYHRSCLIFFRSFSTINTTIK